MTIKIPKTNRGTGLLEKVKKLSGVDVSPCYQCKKCTSGCPVNQYVKSPPAEIMRRLHLGAGEDLLESDLVWTCISCETCFARCPMKINVAAVIDALRQLSLKKGPSKQETVPVFNGAFLNMVQKFGRSYDMGMMASYKMKTGTFKKDLDKFPTMLKKKKIAILPPRGANKTMVKSLFKKVAMNKGEIR